MSNIEHLRTEALSDSIAEEILKYIQDNNLPKGTRIPNEQELASMFSVGRSTIREAVKNLCVRKVLEIRRGNGTFVLSTRPRDNDPLNLGAVKDKLNLAMNLVDVRLLLEPRIAFLAAINGTEEEKKEISFLCNLTEKQMHSGLSYTETDIAFHSAIATASHNIVIKELIPLIDTAVMTFVNVTHKKLFDETIITHRMITDAILSSDAEGAEGAMHMHLTYNRNMIAALVRERERNRIDI